MTNLYRLRATNPLPVMKSHDEIDPLKDKKNEEQQPEKTQRKPLQEEKENPQEEDVQETEIKTPAKSQVSESKPAKQAESAPVDEPAPAEEPAEADPGQLEVEERRRQLQGDDDAHQHADDDPYESHQRKLADNVVIVGELVDLDGHLAPPCCKPFKTHLGPPRSTGGANSIRNRSFQ